MSRPNKSQKHSWLKKANTISRDVAVYYDDWAEKYNEDLKSWEYQAPVEAAKLMKRIMPESGKILDAGCGTGLAGNALKDRGYKDITGIDISEKSILLAQKTEAYIQLKQLDLQKQPFPFKMSEFDAVNCIGVLTYIKDAKSLFQEFCRIVRPGGYIVFSHREDLLNAFRFIEIIVELEDKGFWKNLFTSKPQLYLPQNENFTDEVKVVYYIFQTGEAK